jgi:hypothetical protein
MLSRYISAAFDLLTSRVPGRYEEAAECGRRALLISELEFGPDDVSVRSR